MNREEAEEKYQELLKKLAKYNIENNSVMFSAILKEIRTIQQRILNLDIAEAIATYEQEPENTTVAQI